jgi:hypothetical protein
MAMGHGVSWAQFVNGIYVIIYICNNIKLYIYIYIYMGISQNRGTPKSSTFINPKKGHPAIGVPPF